MSTFAPVYRPVEAQESYHRQVQRRQKRKGSHDVATLGTDSNDDSDAAQPITRQDPYFVAGWSRNKDLPPGPFPHAAIRATQDDEVTIDEELANLNPPVYRVTDNADDLNVITNRRHIDNLTALLHRCVSRGDWFRASRILGLLLRSEYGVAVDLRQHDRWAIAAEVLLRRGRDAREEEDMSKGSHIPVISDTGLKAARQYYERMILQYPHTARSSSGFNASAIYPSLFNIWIFEVQQRSKTARAELDSRPPSPLSNVSEAPALKEDEVTIRIQEITEGEQIAARLDQLIVSPPYDTNVEILRMAAMVAKWLADLHEMVAIEDHAINHNEHGRRQQIRSDGLLQRIADLQR